MTLKTRLSSVLGGENFDDVPVEVIAVEDQPIVLADSIIDKADIVVAEHEQEITVIQNDVETLEERIEDVEQELAGLEAMMAGDTEWNPALAMSMFDRARKLTERTFGAESLTLSVEGIESFADASTAQLMLIEGVESIKEKAKAAGEAIATFFKNLYKSVIAAFVGLFDRLRGIEKRADALSSRLSSLTEDKVKRDIKLGGWNAYLDAEKTGDMLGKLSSINKALGEIGAALNEKTEDAMLKEVKGAFSTALAVMGEKKNSSSNSEEDVTVGSIAGVTFEMVVPKVLKSLRSAKIVYKLTDKVKTSGEFKSSISLANLKGIVAKTKEWAGKARLSKFDQKALENTRNRAIATLESQGDDNSKERIKYIRDGHAAASSMARTLIRYEGDVLIAAQKYVAAHI